MKKILCFVLFAVLFLISCKQRYVNGHIEAAQRFYDSKNYKQSLDAVEDALYLDSSSVAAIHLAGLIYSKLGDHSKSLYYFERALKYSPENAIVKNSLGLLYDDMGMYTEALAKFNEAIQIDPKIFQFYSNRGLTYENLFKDSLAMTDYATSLELKPNDTGALKNRVMLFVKNEMYDEANLNAAKILPKDGVNARYWKSYVCLYSGKYEEAESYLKSLLNSEYDQAIINNDLACIQYKKQNFEGAKKYFLAALKSDPWHANAHNGLGVIYTEGKSNQTDSAFFHLNKALKLKANNPVYFFNRGLAFEKIQDNINACADFTKAANMGYKKAENKMKDVCSKN